MPNDASSSLYAHHPPLAEELRIKAVRLPRVSNCLPNKITPETVKPFPFGSSNSTNCSLRNIRPYTTISKLKKGRCSLLMALLVYALRFQQEKHTRRPSCARSSLKLNRVNICMENSRTKTEPNL
ncbi:hypothetical protein Zmor_012993 [Zophobas morio]|uniref:Uncharacterized protein n=1 Tax=Zophobas morio TaxID=2755281 RepID=A0AA38I9Z9_9CUCU|nr:hypothetical protein Zmor_012993 [Zophobas morio]